MPLTRQVAAGRSSGRDRVGTHYAASQVTQDACPLAPSHDLRCRHLLHLFRRHHHPVTTQNPPPTTSHTSDLIPYPELPPSLTLMTQPALASIPLNPQTGPRHRHAPHHSTPLPPSPHITSITSSRAAAPARLHSHSTTRPMSRPARPQTRPRHNPRPLPRPAPPAPVPPPFPPPTFPLPSPPLPPRLTPITTSFSSHHHRSQCQPCAPRSTLGDYRSGPKGKTGHEAFIPCRFVMPSV